MEADPELLGVTADVLGTTGDVSSSYTGVFLRPTEAACSLNMSQIHVSCHLWRPF